MELFGSASVTFKSYTPYKQEDYHELFGRPRLDMVFVNIGQSLTRPDDGLGAGQYVAHSTPSLGEYGTKNGFLDGNTPELRVANIAAQMSHYRNALQLAGHLVQCGKTAHRANQKVSRAIAQTGMDEFVSETNVGSAVAAYDPTKQNALLKDMAATVSRMGSLELGQNLLTHDRDTDD